MCKRRTLKRRGIFRKPSQDKGRFLDAHFSQIVKGNTLEASLHSSILYSTENGIHNESPLFGTRRKQKETEGFHMGERILNVRRTITLVIFLAAGVLGTVISGGCRWDTSLPKRVDDAAKKLLEKVPIYSAVHRAVPGGHKAKGLLIYCSDFRYGENIRQFLMKKLGITEFDQVAIPGGGALAIINPIDPSYKTTVLSSSNILKKLHKFDFVILVDHTAGCEDGCGGYCNQYPELKDAGPDAEWTKHVEVMSRAGQEFKKLYPSVKVILAIIRPEKGGPDEAPVMDRVYDVS